MSLSSQIQAKVLEAVAANEADDFALAEKKLRSAIMLMAGHPRIKVEDDETEYVRDDLVKFLEEVSRKAVQQAQRQSSAGGFVGIPIRTRIE
jgi:hypothetical protein